MLITGIILIVTGITCIAFWKFSTSQIQTGQEKLGEVTVDLINVEVTSSYPEAWLQFYNGTSERVGLLKYNVFIGDHPGISVGSSVGSSILNDVFRIQSDGVDIPYTGIMAKRGVPKSEDYFWLEPGEKVNFNTFLTQAYEFLDGEHVYTARYEAVHQQPKGASLILKSNEVTFTFDKK